MGEDGSERVSYQNDLFFWYFIIIIYGLRFDRGPPRWPGNQRSITASA